MEPKPLFLKSVAQDTLKEFVELMIEQTEEEMEEQRQIAPNDEWMRFLEGKLMAFRLVGEGFETERGCD